MYYSITGRLVYRDENTAVIETGGISYEILVPQSVSRNLNGEGPVTLFTRMIVRETEIYLVGFTALEDRRLFESLLTVSGIGPKQGLKILSELSAAEIRNAIITGDESTLSGVKGIGVKTASRIILELKDKIRNLQISGITPAQSSAERKKTEVLMALRVLGYTDYESKRAIDTAYSNPEIKDMDVEDIIKNILLNMGR
jgi:Holliday junction DNA helicase RuvA